MSQLHCLQGRVLTDFFDHGQSRIRSIVVKLEGQPLGKARNVQGQALLVHALRPNGVPQLRTLGTNGQARMSIQQSRRRVQPLGSSSNVRARATHKLRATKNSLDCARPFKGCQHFDQASWAGLGSWQPTTVDQNFTTAGAQADAGIIGQAGSFTTTVQTPTRPGANKSLKLIQAALPAGVRAVGARPRQLRQSHPSSSTKGDTTM